MDLQQRMGVDWSSLSHDVAACRVDRIAQVATEALANKRANYRTVQRAMHEFLFQQVLQPGRVYWNVCVHCKRYAACSSEMNMWQQPQLRQFPALNLVALCHRSSTMCALCPPFRAMVSRSFNCSAAMSQSIHSRKVLCVSDVGKGRLEQFAGHTATAHQIHSDSSATM